MVNARYFQFCPLKARRLPGLFLCMPSSRPNLNDLIDITTVKHLFVIFVKFPRSGEFPAHPADLAVQQDRLPAVRVLSIVKHR